MNKIDIAAIIQKKYSLLKAPKETEVALILKLAKIWAEHGLLTEQKLDEIVEGNISEKTKYLTDAVDTSATISILQQIIDAANGK